MGIFGAGGPTNIGSTYTLTLGSGSVIGNGNAFTDQQYQIYVQIGSYLWSLKADSDSDGTPDVDDNCPDLFNPLSQTLMEMALEMSATPMQMMMDSSMKMTTAMGQKQTGTQQISR